MQHSRNSSGTINNPPIHPVEQNIALRFDRVSFSYDKVKVFQETSFHIHEGEFVALAGPNGSGKTTALKLLLGLETPSAGRIELFGLASFRQRERVGYVPQQTISDRAFPITVRDVVKMGCLSPVSRFRGREDNAAADEAMQQAEITELASRPYSALSGGQRRRVLVARALASLSRNAGKGLLGNKPGLLVLDEPTANMDEESETRLFQTLGKLKGNTTILIVTHDRDFVSSLVDRVLCMDKDAHNASEQGNEFTIVQHRIEETRILHEESFPADSCYPLDNDYSGEKS